MDEFVLFAVLLFMANKSNSSVRFLGESTALQSAFWFYLTFKHVNKAAMIGIKLTRLKSCLDFMEQKTASPVLACRHCDHHCTVVVFPAKNLWLYLSGAPSRIGMNLSQVKPSFRPTTFPYSPILSHQPILYIKIVSQKKKRPTYPSSVPPLPLPHSILKNQGKTTVLPPTATLSLMYV